MAKPPIYKKINLFIMKCLFITFTASNSGKAGLLQGQIDALVMTLNSYNPRGMAVLELGEHGTNPHVHLILLETDDKEYWMNILSPPVYQTNVPTKKQYLARLTQGATQVANLICGYFQKEEQPKLLYTHQCNQEDYVSLQDSSHVYKKQKTVDWKVAHFKFIEVGTHLQESPSSLIGMNRILYHLATVEHYNICPLMTHLKQIRNACMIHEKLMIDI